MRCTKCGFPVNINWKYCPNCGKKIFRSDFLSEFDRMCQEVLEEIQGSQLMNSKIKKIKEPKSSIIINGFDTIYEFYLPNINQDKINIRKVGESLELRAVKNDTLFFKIVKAPSNAYISEKEYNNGIFRVIVKGK